MTDLNLKRRRHSCELQAVLSQLAAIWKYNEVLHTELDITKTHKFKKVKFMADTKNRIVAMSATMSERKFFNLTTTATNPSLSDSPFLSTGIKK